MFFEHTPGTQPATLPAMQHVAIVGSGVIGLSTAFALRQRGVPRVTVLEGAWDTA